MSGPERIGRCELWQGDCREVLRGLPEESIESCVTDPPYLLEFMGKAFDKQHKALPGANDGQKMQAWHSEWAPLVFDLLKPGGYIAAFGGERTFHRLAAALEDAGFEPRHTITWLFGSGFPKNRNVSKDLANVDWCSCD